jgi:prevent-host-death family protein
MATVTVAFAKKHLSQLINRALHGEEIVIARGNRPIVKLVRVTDAFDPLTDQELEDLGFG